MNLQRAVRPLAVSYRRAARTLALVLILVSLFAPAMIGAAGSASAPGQTVAAKRSTLTKIEFGQSRR
ncbi:MAG: hypothetical protein LYZ66_02775 [Nitrososphaerales archaeon]|nr:hypothetical protein [Nitrososphaerales archaeon]